jgi:hypothetical protein
MAGKVSGTTNVPLPTWFCAMYHITQTKCGISSIELGRRHGTAQTTAWKIKTKLVDVIRFASERDSSPDALRWLMPTSTESAAVAAPVAEVLARKAARGSGSNR